MKNYFFEPHVGSAYHSGCGPYGKRILILGSSFYCPYVYDDKACMECTDINKKDSSKYDESCKIYRHRGPYLREEGGPRESEEEMLIFLWRRERPFPPGWAFC